MSQTEVQLIKASAVVTADIADQAVTLDKLAHGTSSNNGKFLRANNGADPSFETVSTDLVNDTSPQLGGDLDTNGNNISFDDNDQLRLGNATGGDIVIKHTTSDNNGHIENHTGDLLISTKGAGDDVIIEAVDDIELKPKGGEDGIKVIGDGAVELYHNNVKSFETKDIGAIVTNSTGSGNRVLDVKNPSNNYCFISWNDQNTTDTGTVRIGALANEMLIYSGGNHAIKIDSNGHFLPATNNTFDLGSSSLRWRNVYTNDLNLSNKGSSNDVDGTWGDYTIQEGAEDLFLINKRNGKKFKFNLTEVA